MPAVRSGRLKLRGRVRRGSRELSGRGTCNPGATHRRMIARANHFALAMGAEGSVDARSRSLPPAGASIPGPCPRHALRPARRCLCPESAKADFAPWLPRIHSPGRPNPVETDRSGKRTSPGTLASARGSSTGSIRIEPQRREWDSNPRGVATRRFSRPVHSTALPSLLGPQISTRWAIPSTADSLRVIIAMAVVISRAHDRRPTTRSEASARGP
jgi:hypothetical protein